MKNRVEWFKNAGYGIFCHWTTHSLPQYGEKKSHAQAIEDFDVDGFTKQIIDTGAKFLFFTITHADMFLPFPLKELDDIVNVDNFVGLAPKQTEDFCQNILAPAIEGAGDSQEDFTVNV